MGERDRLSRFDFEAGSIQGVQMSINNAEFTALENAVNRALDEIDRLRSENAELRAALEMIARSDCVADDLKSANDLRAIANGVLEKSC